MASLSSDKNGNRVIQFQGEGQGAARSVSARSRCRSARKVQGHVEELVAANPNAASRRACAPPAG